MTKSPSLELPYIERRRSPRAPFTGRFTYAYDGGQQAAGQWLSVSREGAGAQLGRYLSPGKRLVLNYSGLELVARVIWCRPNADKLTFSAGLNLDEAQPQSDLLALAATVRRFQTSRPAAPPARADLVTNTAVANTV